MALINSISQNLIKPKNLKKVLRSKRIKILDCRWYLEDKKKGYMQYRRKHIPKAIFFDIDKISNKESQLPHMFPKTNIFTEFINKSGINKNSEIIIDVKEFPLIDTVTILGVKANKIRDALYKELKLKSRSSFNEFFLHICIHCMA